MTNEITNPDGFPIIAAKKRDKVPRKRAPSPPHVPITAERKTDLFIQKLRKIYKTTLDSGHPGKTCICNYQGLVQLALDYPTPHVAIKAIIDVHFMSRTREQLDLLAAYGYEVLCGNV